MSSKQTKGSQEKKPMPKDWSPIQMDGGKTKSGKQSGEELEAEFLQMIASGVIDGVTPKRGVDNGNVNSIQPGNRNDTTDSLQTEVVKPIELIEASEVIQPKEQTNLTGVPRRVTTKQRKESLEEYRQAFLTVPKLEDRKPVFISCEVRDRIDEIVHRLGGRGRSVSGFIENLALHHLEMYHEDIEIWRKL